MLEEPFWSHSLHSDFLAICLKSKKTKHSGEVSPVAKVNITAMERLPLICVEALFQ